jgi:hypothetical protein
MNDRGALFLTFLFHEKGNYCLVVIAEHVSDKWSKSFEYCTRVINSLLRYYIKYIRIRKYIVLIAFSLQVQIS